MILVALPDEFTAIERIDTPGCPYTGALSERLRRAVEARAGRRFHDFRVVGVEEAGVVLYGRTDCYHAKQLAQHVVGALTGRTVVANRIEVFPHHD